MVGFALVSSGDVVTSKLLPGASLGIYQMAPQLATMAAMELARVIAAVTFPAFSLLQTDLPRLQAAFLKSFFFACVVSLAETSAVIVPAHDVVAIFQPPEWADAAPAMQFLAIWGACRGLGSSHGALFHAGNRPGLAALFPFLMLLMLGAFAVPVTHSYGLVGVSALLATIGTIVQLLRYPLMPRVLNIKSFPSCMRSEPPPVSWTPKSAPCGLWRMSWGEKEESSRMNSSRAQSS